ncbi:unnamed protein product [Pedinophyceae sp. YPF-701]|nr:unnamed protein product [Pedinophyceae sp. YPF-701]
MGGTFSEKARLCWQLSTERATVKKSLIVAAVVGVVLNLINQGPVIFSGKHPTYWKLGLTFVVPFLVATYGALMAKLGFRQEMADMREQAAAARAAIAECRCGAAGPRKGGEGRTAHVAGGADGSESSRSITVEV